MQELELKCFQIISAAGVAKSDFIEAISQIKNGDISRAMELVKEGEKSYVQGHDAHTELLALKDAAESINSMVFVMHAEDQLMAAELYKTMFMEFKNVYGKLSELENEVGK